MDDHVGVPADLVSHSAAQRLGVLAHVPVEDPQQARFLLGDFFDLLVGLPDLHRGQGRRKPVEHHDRGQHRGAEFHVAFAEAQMGKLVLAKPIETKE